jgi:high affinity Mn2+ porin
MAGLGRILSNNLNTRARFAIGATCAAMVVTSASNVFADDIFVTKAPPLPFAGPAYNWNGFYFGGHFGEAWGYSNWDAGPGISGSTSFLQQNDTFNEGGSFFSGIQGGYNHMLPNRVLVGGEVDASFPAFQFLPTGINPFGVSTGGSSNFTSPTLGAVTLTETVLSSGTVRARLGYAPGHWLFYATGGFAWSYDQQSLAVQATGNTEQPFLWRLGWTVGVGVETPIAPHWTARVEYLFINYGSFNWAYFGGAQPVSSDLKLNEVRFGLNYQFGGDPAQTSPILTRAPAAIDPDNLSLHGQSTFVWQGYPAFRSPYQGAQSLPGGGMGRETLDAILFIGVRPWTGAEIWVDPEIDQGHGLEDTHGIAGFPSGESYKLGFSYPYTRVNRYFLRQTINLGGETEKVDDDANQFAGSQTANRLVLTVGRFYMLDIFDTNKYASNPKTDFLNWSIINNGAFDFGGDAWSNTYGAVAEWYQGNWAFRGGVFDMSQTPAGGGGDSALSYGLDPTFHNFELLGEIENRFSLWGQPGKIKLTGFLIRGDMGNYDNAIALSQATGLDASDALAAVRTYQSRPGLLLNLEQQVTETVGLFARAGWADGNVEPWDNTDIDRSISGGLSFNGKTWNRPNDTIGVAGVVNGISSAHIAYLNAGGTGIVIGDGQLPHYGLEQIVETYYSYAISLSTKVSLDYQFVANPAYNTDRGPVNIFAGRFHTQF